jgi:Class III cytochrome C family
VERHKIFAALLAPVLLMAVASIVVGQEAPPAPVPLKGPTMGTVVFPHSAHTRVAGKCEVCHHPSNPEKPLKAAQEACTDCHTKPPTPPVRVGLQAAFHNPTASAGLCITCHKTENAEGKAAPVKCADCHKKDNS